MPSTFRISRDDDDPRRWRFRLYGSNGTVIATSKAYKSKASAYKGCEALRSAVPTAKIYTDHEYAWLQDHKYVLTKHDPVVYYVLFTGSIKIGYSINLRRRLDDYRVALPEKGLLAVEPGGRDVELMRHQQFEHLRIKPRREDFADAPELRQYAAEIAARHGDPLAWLTPQEAA